MAFHAIRAGEGHAFVSAGVETISQYTKGNSDSLPDTHNPRFDEAQERTRRPTEPWSDPRLDGLMPNVYISMGETAENVASYRGISREEMDDFAFQSQRRYAEAESSGFWAQEITPIETLNGKLISEDDSPRRNADRDAMSSLQPAFREGGRVTAGNSCPLNDGAAALVVVSDELADRLELQPLARIVATGVSALSPEIMGLGPVEASQRALNVAGMKIDDMDIVEINEAFAAQVIPSARDLGIDFDHLNPFGGSIAVGHPFGMSGARITGTLINGLRSRDGTLGLATMCVGGGQGMAMILERVG